MVGVTVPGRRISVVKDAAPIPLGRVHVKVGGFDAEIGRLVAGRHVPCAGQTPFRAVSVPVLDAAHPACLFPVLDLSF